VSGTPTNRNGAPRVRLGALHAPSRPAAPVPTVPFRHCWARVLGAGPYSLVLLNDGRGGIQFDRVNGVGPSGVLLESGRSLPGFAVIAPLNARVPGAVPYWAAPGRGLWDAVWERLSPTVRAQIEGCAGITMTRAQREQVIADLFTACSRAGSVIAGRRLPLGPQDRFIPIGLDGLSLLDVDLVIERALARRGCEGAAEPLAMLRLFTSEEWLAVDRGAPAPSPRPVGARARPDQAAVNAWILGLHQRAHSEGKPPPKRDIEVFPACADAIGATDCQMRLAMQGVPKDLKRRRGARDREPANRAPNRAPAPAAR
jgi:hypothetical protein